ncbi:hypothetical protein BGW42_007350 [Actinomortierella wolfii]|nr:hypothetical protein BGW42_007350 [Actinomortierella wolfii]
MASQIVSASSDEAGFKRLVVLESEYRTHRPADQLHAIASFPQLFEEFPNPVIINSAFLKLADYFHETNNVQRHAILQVFKKSEAHLKLILNVEETIRRISPTLQSNDPLGRAITLRVLGCMASIVNDRVDVYHNVIHCLDSTEAMEVSAAIYVADRICAHSQKFCAIISGKLAYMIRDPKVALPFKRRLIRIFGHMFEDITLARLARKTCLDMLELNQDAEYTVSILKTLTRLASYSLVDIELLLQMAYSHDVAGIRYVALMCLGSLASQTVDFEPSQVKRLFDIASSAKDEKTSARAMGVLVRLFQSSYLVSGLILEDGGDQTLIEFLRLAVNLISLEQHSTTFGTAIEEAFKLASTMLESYRLVVQDDAADLSQLRSVFEESLQAVVARLEHYVSYLLELRQPPVSLAEEEPHPLYRRYLNMYIKLSLWDNSLVSQLLQQFASWLSSFPCHNSLLLDAFHRVAQQRPLDVLACKTILTANSMRTSSTSVSFVSRMTELFHRFGGWNQMTEQYSKHHWEMYQIGRAALRSGWPQLARVAFHSLSVDIETVPCRQWIGALQELAQAETYLNENMTSSPSDKHPHSPLPDLSKPQQLYARAIGRLEEMEVYQHRGGVNRAFQLQFCQLRTQFFQACRRALILLQQMSLVSSGSQYGTPSGTTALLQCASTLNEIAHHYTLMKLQVAQQPQSELALEVLQTTCLVLAFSIQRVVRSASAVTKDKKQATTADNGSLKDKNVNNEMDVFNIDPLLIPLLYAESTEKLRGQANDTASNLGSVTGSNGRCSGDTGSDQTANALFRASIRHLLRYIEETINSNTLNHEQRFVVAKQVVLQILTMPIPFPQRFFNSA